jgi:uncharacterized protein
MTGSQYTGLKKTFSPPERFRSVNGQPYTLLPFRFSPLDSSRYVLTNFSGEYRVVSRRVLQSLVKKTLPRYTPEYDDLKALHFLIDEDSAAAIDLLATKYRTKQSHLAAFTCLHLFIVTLRCDHGCLYCQVTRQPEQAGSQWDMTPAIADSAVDFMFRSPNPALTVEFQGGEPLLNYELVRYIIERVEAKNLSAQRDVRFVVCTNLSPLTSEMLGFFAQHNVYISTSIDGPSTLHNASRRRSAGDSHGATALGIRKVQDALGPDRISALMTTTDSSLVHAQEIVDEYVRLGFSDIFVRSIHPYGYAVKTGVAQYEIQEWLEFYEQVLRYIIHINAQGIRFREGFASLMLRRMLTPWATGYVDLQSPAGIGVSVLAYNYDGQVYASDEGRMLAEMGDQTFRLGNVASDSYEGVMLSESLLEPLHDSIAECVPGCADCGFLPFCGSDPVRHYRTQGDYVGFKPTSEFCKKNKGVMRVLIRLLEDDPAAAQILRSWV